jgi:hypothetical protein
MKAVQVGILAALLVCAGILFQIYRRQPAVIAPQEAVAEASPSPTVTPTSAPETTPTPAAAEAERPSPMRGKPPRTEVARNDAPASTTPVPATDEPPLPAAEPAPEGVPHPPVALNPPPETQSAPPPRVTIPAGTMITVRLAETLSSARNQPGDTFTATLDQPLVVDGYAIAERGATVRGKVVEAEQAGRVKGVARLAVRLTGLHTSDGQDVVLATGSYAREGPTSHKEDAEKVGVGAAVGAIIGAIAGGGKGAAIGAGVGGAAGGGVVAATRGKPAELPVETRLTFRLEKPITLTERIP